ncbi:MAG TPA: hypothetical protein VF789_29595 [Thermoanaerobaculia bacterium]
MKALLSTTSISLPAAREEVLRESVSNLQFLASRSPLKEIFSPGSKAFEAMGGFAGTVKVMAENQLTFYLNAVTTAALIFSHTVLDAAVTDFCRVIAEESPESWDSLLDNKTAKFEQVRSSGVDAIRCQLLDSLLNQLDRESLPRRIERLLGICKPSDLILNSEGYTFCAERIRRIDDWRHQLVHHSGAVAPTMEEVREEVDYLEVTTYRLMSCLFERFEIFPDLSP